jgi:mRNA interferase HigB
MKVHLIKKQTIEDYITGHSAGRSSFGNWLTSVKLADWDRPDDIQQTFAFADILGNGSNRVVFNIGGNNYRIICKYHFGTSRVYLFVCWIGTHSDYQELCNKNKQFTANHHNNY